LRLGLIARADNSGLGTQCWGYARNLNPVKVLVIDVSHFHNNTSHANKATYRDRYPDAQFYCGWRPPETLLAEFLDGLDCVLTAECAYNNELYTLAKAMGVKVVLAPNYEFLDTTARPDVWAMPSLWHFDDVPFSNKIHLPVPIETDRFADRTPTGYETATDFLHLVGRPAAHDRNGTPDLLQALQYVTAEVTVTIKCQDVSYVPQLLNRFRVPENVTLVVDSTDVENYWDNYHGDVLLMPRRFGGLCLPVNEALGAGMPVIMPDIAPNNSWLPSDWLVPATHAGTFKAKQHIDIYSVDHRAYAAKIDALAGDPGLYTKAKTEALELREQYSWNKLRPTYLRTLQELS
jgi:glycosyltransferase involved in cell wall biosynthesis